MPYLVASVHFPDELAPTMRTRINRAEKGAAVSTIAKEFEAARGDVRRAEVRSYIGLLTASMVITCDQSAAVDNTDTLTIAGGTALAVKASPANQDQVAKGASSAAFAANVVAKINANTVTSKFVWAAVTTSASGIITVYSLLPGVIGNLITVSKAGNGFTLVGSALAGGTNDAPKYYQLGYNRPARVAG
jgi:hypothetical protein